MLVLKEMDDGGIFLSAANETEIIYKTQTLAEWCGVHNEPYTSIEPGGKMVQRFGVGQKFLDVTSPPVFFGRLSDSLILPVSTFSCTPDHTLIHAGLTHRDYGLASDIGPFLVEDLAENKFLLRIPNDMPTVDQECIFLGGRANFGHFLFESLMRWTVGARIPNSDSLPVALYDGLSAQEQVQLVGNARAMILHSGAANAISLFAPQDCAIVEFQPTSVSAYFGPLAYASCLGQPYRRIHCRVGTAEEAQAAGLAMNSVHSFDADYWVDCQALDAALKVFLS